MFFFSFALIPAQDFVEVVWEFKMQSVIIKFCFFATDRFLSE